jgi:hypothetical protein
MKKDVAAAQRYREIGKLENTSSQAFLEVYNIYIQY